jgi:hypothetical protein
MECVLSFSGLRRAFDRRLGPLDGRGLVDPLSLLASLSSSVPDGEELAVSLGYALPSSSSRFRRARKRRSR